MRLDFLGEFGADIVVFGEGDVEPLLGVTALASAGMVVDPRTRQFRRLPILPLKPRLPGSAWLPRSAADVRRARSPPTAYIAPIGRLRTPPR